MLAAQPRLGCVRLIMSTRPETGGAKGGLVRFVSGCLIFVLCIAASIPVHAQKRIEAHGCTRSGTQYNCDKGSFERILQVSKAVSVNTPGIDASSSEQLQKLARALGKAVRSDNADLTFVLVRPEPSGIYYGPSNRDLADIRVYYGATANDPGKLVWVESYYGQPGAPWPIVVHHLTDQFRKDLKR